MNETEPNPSASTLPLDRLAINFRWFYKLRWAAIAGQTSALLFCRLALAIEWPWREMIALIGVVAASNVLLGWWLARRDLCGWDGWRTPGTGLLGATMALDNAALTCVIALAGGPENPFTIFYLINVTLAAVVLDSRWAWALCCQALACFALLFWLSDPMSADLGHTHSHELPAVASPHTQSMHRHLQGMLVAFAAASGLIVYFVTRVTTALAHRDSEVALARERKAHHERVEALATLAAGAAHELATPLSTIAVLARELELDLDARDEVAAIRVEVDRCRRILDDMATSAGQSVGEAFTQVTPTGLIDVALADLSKDRKRRVHVSHSFGDTSYCLPVAALGRSIRALVANGLDASPNDASVEVSVREDGHRLSIVVKDVGAGMSADVLRRVGDPFFSTKEPGQGMGLGLFLARQIVERIGGSLTLTSQIEKGTIATISLPNQAARSSNSGSASAAERVRQFAASSVRNAEIKSRE